MGDCFLRNIPRKARKNHRCDYCGQPIHAGEFYEYSTGIYDSTYWDCKGHIECVEECDDTDDEFSRYCYERPDYRLTNLGLVLRFEKFRWPTHRVENYKRPVLLNGFL